jgi:predicted dinucleotide-binding enzyme
MSEALASRWAGHHEVVIGGRNIEKAKALAEQIDHGTSGGREADAVKDTDVVVLATTRLKSLLK